MQPAPPPDESGSTRRALVTPTEASLLVLALFFLATYMAASLASDSPTHALVTLLLTPGLLLVGAYLVALLRRGMIPLRVTGAMPWAVCAMAAVVGIAGGILAGPTNPQLLAAAFHYPVPLVFVWVGLLAPVIEEVFFRGVLFSALDHDFGPVPAAILSAGAFALAHLGGPAGLLGALFVFGLVLAALRIRTGSVLAPYLAHVGWNLSTLAYGNQREWGDALLPLAFLALVLLIGIAVRGREEVRAR